MVEPDRLGDRYRIKRRLASEANATIYLAEDELRGSPVTIKMLHEDLVSDPDVRKDLSKRARAVAALSHPNIVRVLDHGDEDGRQFIVVEHVEGRTLDRVLAEEGPPAPMRAVDIAVQVCDALAHAHAAGIVHGGLNPTGVFVTNDDRVRVSGFEVGPGGHRSPDRHRSPESAAGKRIGPETDLYSLGIILFDLLDEAAPDKRDGFDSGGAPAGISPGGVPPALVEVVRRATATRADNRYRSAAALRSALEDALLSPERNASRKALESSASYGSQKTPAGAPGGDQKPPWPLPADRYDAESLGKRVLAGFLVLVLVALGAFFWRLRTEVSRDDPGGGNGGRPTVSGSAGQVSIPDVVGMEGSAAVESLADVGFESDIRAVPSRGSSGIVLDQNPNAGTEGVTGSRVILFVGREVGGAGDGPSDPVDPSGPPSPSP
ncbi:MAG: protein kinase [Actinomycetota bacterium]|nr:protein kinase [Actinomycetota bacterium]